MNPFEEMTEYLRVKVNKVNVNNPKANSGAVLLKLYPKFNVEASEILMLAFHTLQLHFTTDNPNNPVGTAGLTMVSTAIGFKVHRHLSREPVPWNMQVRLGDLFIETFKEHGYIDLYYPKARDTSYIVSATPCWLKLADIPEMMAKVPMGYTKEHPIKQGIKIKGQEGYHTSDHPWVRAAMKVQNTGWRIDDRILETVVKHKDEFVSNTPVEDNEALEMKRISKTVEWSILLAKAKRLVDKDVFYQEVEADYRGRLYFSEAFLNFQGSDVARGMMKFARAKPMTEDGMFWLAVHTANSFNQTYEKDEIPEWCEADYRSHLEAEELDTISVDKFTLEDRVRWTNENMEVISHAGRERVFAYEAEKPISFLACCLEWFDIDTARRDGRMHMSNLPIPIDGSNNGWQHLGAMSKDPQTGELVGLVARDIQQDFYVQVAKSLVHYTEDEYRKGILSEMKMKQIRKGIAKRGAMTRAYSAGATTIAENMFFDCKVEGYHLKFMEFQERLDECLESGKAQEALDKGYKFKRQLPTKTPEWAAVRLSEEQCEAICLGFARDLITAINHLCPGPLQTMEYLQSLAAFEIGKHQKFKDGVEASSEYLKLRKEIEKKWRQPDKTDEDLEEINDLVKESQTYETRLVYGNGSDRITWTTPSKFPVVYTKFRTESKKCRGTISGKQIKHVAKIATKAPDINGFLCGISPNFVHSMDASHMAMVIDEWNGDFGAVHDSFSTHACDVEDLIALTKRVFIDMYDVDNFYDYIENEVITDKTHLDVEQPTIGSLRIQGVQDSDYFFA